MNFSTCALHSDIIDWHYITFITIKCILVISLMLTSTNLTIESNVKILKHTFYNKDIGFSPQCVHMLDDGGFSISTYSIKIYGLSACALSMLREFKSTPPLTMSIMPDVVSMPPIICYQYLHGVHLRYCSLTDPSVRWVNAEVVCLVKCPHLNK